MKSILLLTVLLGTLNSYACQCEKYPLSHGDVIKKVVNKKFGQEVKLDLRQDVTAIKAYPSIVEKLDLFGFRGTSCEVSGPQGESLYHCINRVKYDYLVKVGSCELIVRAKSNYKKAKAKVVSTTCK